LYLLANWHILRDNNREYYDLTRRNPMRSKSAQNHHPHLYNAGFTLVELSIVLVIIGLIVGGVLAGQQLIKAAQLRAQMTQMNQFSTAVGTFNTQFNSLPGDWSNNPATSGYQTRAYTTAGRGDQNGVLESVCQVASHPEYADGETFMFWRDLTDANLVNFSSTYVDSVCGTDTSATSMLPPANYKHANLVTVFGTGGINYYHIAVTPAASAAGSFAAGSPAASTGFTTFDAQSLDAKLDDGLPNSGSIRAAGGAPNTAAVSGASGTAGACVNSTPTPNQYNLAITTYSCALRFQMQ
jgi:prepilin-type N-terminal cleavage/methylation domain-containing protein